MYGLLIGLYLRPHGVWYFAQLSKKHRMELVAMNNICICVLYAVHVLMIYFHNIRKNKIKVIKQISKMDILYSWYSRKNKKTINGVGDIVIVFGLFYCFTIVK